MFTLILSYNSFASTVVYLIDHILLPRSETMFDRALSLPQYLDQKFRYPVIFSDLTKRPFKWRILKIEH